MSSSNFARDSVDVQVLRARRVGGDERQVDLRRGGRGELDLRALGGLGEALKGLRVLAQIDPLVALELLRDPVDDPPVEVVAAEMAIATHGANLDHAVAHVEQRYVEGPAPEVEHEHRLLALLVEPVRERRGGRLVDDPQDLEPGDLPRVLGRLPLRVVEVSGHGDDRLGHLFAQRLGRVVSKLAQDHARDLLGRVLLAADLDPDRVVGAADDLVGDDLRLLVHLTPLAPDEALDRVDGRLRVEDRLALRHLAHQALPVLREGDHGRGDPGALGVRDHLGLPALHRGGDDRVRGAEVDANCLGHVALLSGPVRARIQARGMCRSMELGRPRMGSRSRKWQGLPFCPGNDMTPLSFGL